MRQLHLNRYTHTVTLSSRQVRAERMPPTSDLPLVVTVKNTSY